MPAEKLSVCLFLYLSGCIFVCKKCANGVVYSLLLFGGECLDVLRVWLRQALCPGG